MSVYQVAIDGPAGSGKSTVAKLVAKKLGFLFIDTGAMYRAITLKVLNNSINLNDECKIINLTKDTKIEFAKGQKDQQIVLLDGSDVSKEIRMPNVTNTVSIIAKITGVRKALVKVQQQFGENNSVVMEGRDIGSVVFPKAFLKIYLSASIEERANRRFAENKTKGINTDIETLKEEIAKRDLIDSTRKESPLVKVADAIEIETDNLNIDQVTNKIIEIFNEKLNGKQD